MPKIYDFTGAPNPRRVRVFLAEKGINNVPFEQVNIATADNRKPEFLKINPMGGLPVLELDDGTHIAESVAICRPSGSRRTFIPSGSIPRNQSVQ